MAGLSASGLKTQIRSYTEVDSNVLTDSVLENIILNAQYRIFRDVPIDADRKQQTGNLVAGQETINCPAGAVFIRGIQVYSTAGSEITGANRWLEKKIILIFKSIKTLLELLQRKDNLNITLCLEERQESLIQHQDV